MLKKIVIPILLLFLSSCGYEAVNSKKNLTNNNFFISELITEGDRNVNIKIREKLLSYILRKKGKDLILIISSSAEKVITAKNTAGDPTSFKYTLIIKTEAMFEKKLVKGFIIKESFNYNNNTNKFELKRYEKEIINNLTETAAQKLIYKLSNI